jgi:tol-pal system protein YbgF
MHFLDPAFRDRHRRPGRWLFVLSTFFCTATAGAQPAGAPLVTQHQLSVIEMRLERVERVFDSAALTEMLQGVDQMQGEIRQLRGQLEQAENELRVLRDRLDGRMARLEERLLYLEGGQDFVSAPAGDLPPAIPDDWYAGPEEQDAYEEAFERLMAGEHEEAIRMFEGFIEAYPDGVFAANALFWLAEGKYALGEFEGALIDYAAVRERHPGSDKAPDALLKQGYAYFELGQMDAAREALSQVQADYPGTTLSRLAQDRLRRIGNP